MKTLALKALLLLCSWMTIGAGMPSSLFLGHPTITSIPRKGSSPREASVWICKSRAAYAYHSSRNCNGLNRCKSEIVRVKISTARSVYGRSPCKICY